MIFFSLETVEIGASYKYSIRQELSNLLCFVYFLGRVNDSNFNLASDRLNYIGRLSVDDKEERAQNYKEVHL